MQKKIIALAVAGLMSGAAFAQSNVTISGLYGVTLGRGIAAAPGLAAAVGTTTQERNTGLVANDGHINFAATEDLGNGWKAGANMELRLRGREASSDSSAAAGAAVGGDGTGGRNAIVFLTTPYGTLDFGSIELGNGIWGLGSAGAPIAQLDKIWEGTSKISGANTTWILSTQANADLMRYTSPVFMGGVQIYALRADSIGDPGPVAQGPGTTGHAQALGVNYNNGPIAFNMDVTNFSQYRRVEGQNRTRMSGAYNFGVVRIGAGYEKNSRWQSQSVLGISAPIGAQWVVGAAYAKNHQLDNKAWAAGVDYNFSKRTSINFSYSNATITNINGAANTAAVIDAGGAKMTAVANYTDGKQAGLRLQHKF
jgi:predicted porin